MRTKNKFSIGMDMFIPSQGLLDELKAAKCWFVGKPMFMQCHRCGREPCILRKGAFGSKATGEKPRRQITFEGDVGER